MSSNLTPFTSPDDLAFAELRNTFLSLIRRSNLGCFSRLMVWRERGFHYNLLLGASRFWDPDFHVFRFGVDELCPTFEEFSTILHLPLDAPIASPDYSGNIRAMLVNVFRIHRSHAATFIVNGFLDLRVMTRFFLSHRGDVHLSYGRHMAACVLLVAEMLLVTGSYSVRPIVAFLTSQARYGRSIVPIILAETFHGLDVFCDIGEMGEAMGGLCLRGSPRLLYIWLTERLRIVSTTEARSLRCSVYFFERFFCLPIRTDVDSYAEFLSHLPRAIAWHIPWWPIRSVVFGLSGQGYVRLRGLTQTSFYIPDRVRRQFNLPQTVFRPLRNFQPGSVPVTRHLSLLIHRIWETRTPYPVLVSRGIVLGPLGQSFLRSRFTELMTDGAFDDDLQCQWFRDFGGGEISLDSLVAAYGRMDEERRATAAEALEC